MVGGGLLPRARRCAEVSVFNYIVTGTDVADKDPWDRSTDGMMSASTMDGSGNRKSVGDGRSWPRPLRALVVVLGVLAFPIAAHILGSPGLSRVGTADQAQHFLRAQILLVLAGVVVSGVGGVLIWSTATSLARAAEVDTSQKRRDDGPAGPLPERASLSTSVTRMLRTIERQADEINQFAAQLDSAHRELEGVKARFQAASFVDAATGLYNERFFIVRLEQEVARHQRFGHPLSLVLVELSAVEAPGDERGTAAGDEVLRGVVDVLRKNSRGVDMICRYGDEELAILLVETPRAEAGAYAQRIRDIVSACLEGHGGQATASFGTASLPDDAGSGPDLVHVAAAALDATRRAGKNGVAVYGESGAESSGIRGVPAA